MRFAIIGILFCLATAASCQIPDSLLKLPKETLVKMATDILAEEENPINLTLYDRVSVRPESGGVIIGVDSSRLQSRSRVVRMSAYKRNTHLIVRFDQHIIFIPKNKTKYGYGIRVNLSNKSVSHTGIYGMNAGSNELFAANLRQRSKIKFVKRHINKDEKLKSLYERSKENGNVIVIDKMLSYSVKIGFSRAEEYSFDIRKFSGKISNVSRKLYD